MATPARVKANRNNAKKSTGPKTPQGKARVSRNALKHGLSASRDTLLPYEDPAEFHELATTFIENFQPRNQIETVLVQRIINAAWRLRRAERYENRLVAGFTLNSDDYDDCDEDVEDGKKAFYSRILTFFNEGNYARIERYQTAAERSFFRALNAFRKQRRAPIAGYIKNYETNPIPDQPTLTPADIYGEVNPENKPNEDLIVREYQEKLEKSLREDNLSPIDELPHTHTAIEHCNPRPSSE